MNGGHVLWLRSPSMWIGVAADGIERIDELVPGEPPPIPTLTDLLGLPTGQGTDGFVPGRVLHSTDGKAFAAPTGLDMAESGAEDLLGLPAFLAEAWPEVHVHGLARRGDSLSLVLGIAGRGEDPP